MHDWILPSSGASSILELTEDQIGISKLVSLFLRNDNKLCERSNMDVMNSYGNEICMPLDFSTDVLVRYTRDLDSKRVWLELWDTSSGNYSYSTGNEGAIIDEAQFKTLAGAAVLGSTNNYLLKPWSETGGKFNIAWLKLHNSSLGINAPRPRASNLADLGDWLFDNNGNTRSSYDMPITFANTEFVDTPDLSPIAVAVTEGRTAYSSWISLRAAHPNKLDGTGSFSDELEPLKFKWTHKNGPSTLSFDDDTLAQPTVTNVKFGTYVVTLQVTSALGLQGETDFAFGAVTMDDNGVVIYEPEHEYLNGVYGPMIAFGKSVWPFLDNRHQAMSNFYGNRLMNGDWKPTWRNLLQGTVSVDTDSSVITGEGTNFAQDFSCDPQGQGDAIAIRYEDPAVTTGITPGYRFRFAFARSCTATQMVLGQSIGQGAWDGPNVTQASYGKLSYAEFFRFCGGGDNVNYYDNVLAHYALYYRSGFELYRDYARYLADDFIEHPSNDYYRIYGVGANLYNSYAPRVRAAAGIMLRALDGRPDLWEFIWNNYINYEVVPRLQIDFRGQLYFNRDPRENAYSTSAAGLFAQLYPDDLKDSALRKQTVIDAINASVERQWMVTLRADGSQRNYYPDRMACNGRCVVQVTNGQTVVTAINGTFVDTMCTYRVWFVTSWLGDDQDTVSYACTRDSDTQITLSEAYQGTTGLKQYTSELVNSPPTQPFMQGVLTNGLWHAYQATGNEQLAEHIKKTVKWIKNVGWRARSKGLYYIRSAVDCEPNPENLQFCVDQGDGDSATREYAAEVLGAFSRSFLLDKTQDDVRLRGDQHVGVLFGQPGYGGPETEDEFVGGALFLPEVNGGGRLGKYFGFYFGFGFASTWPAARIGGQSPLAPFVSDSPSVAPGVVSGTVATSSSTVLSLVIVLACFL